MRKKSILYLCPENPFPPDGGDKIRIMNLVRLLAEHYEIDLVAYEAIARGDGKPLASAPAGCRVHSVPRRDYKKTSLRLRSVLLRRNNSLLSHTDLHFSDVIRRLSSERAYDYIVVTHSFMGHLLPLLRKLQPRAVLVTDTHNFETRLSREFALTQGTWLRKRYFLLASRWNKRLEKRICKQTDILLATSEPDAEQFARLSPRNKRKVQVIPNFLDSAQYETAVSDEGASPLAPAVVLPGTMSYYPNVNGALYFHEHIYPALKKRIPNIRWYIVGKDCPPEIAAIADKDSSIAITGYVPDVGVYVRQASVVIVPLLEGGGTRLKILEAWAYGRPVVSTSKGAEGISYTDGRDICIADEPQAFTEAIVRLIEDRDFAKAVAERARTQLFRLYDRNAVRRRLMPLFGIESIDDRDRSDPTECSEGTLTGR